jgi:beta-lactamase class A
MSVNQARFTRRTGIVAAGLTSMALAGVAMAHSDATPAAAIAIPDTPAGSALTWVLAQLAPDAPSIDPAEIELHFTASFLAAVPADQLVSVFDQIRAGYAPITLDSISPDSTDTQLAANITTAAGEAWLIYVEVEATGDHLITGLLFQPASAQATPEPLTGFDDLQRRWSAFAAHAGMNISELSGGELVLLHGDHVDTPFAIGSAFKLYVLGALATAIGKGELAWDDELAIQDELKSLPSGELQDEPDGTMLPVRTFAEKMISISDNTATDHLIQKVGREHVEAIMTPMGNQDPSRSFPFLKTKEMFQLKLAASEELRNRYISADVPARRALLESEVESLEIDLTKAAAWTTPREIDTLEWFASPNDLVNAMVYLKAQSDQKAAGFGPVADILSINPGVPFDAETWPYIGYKGGSEPGVLTLTWLLRRNDDRWFVTTGSLNDPNKPLDEDAAVMEFAGVVSLLADL